PVRRDRRYHRLAALGRQVPQRRRHRDRDGRHALGDRHGAHHQDRAPRTGEIPFGLIYSVIPGRASARTRNLAPQYPDSGFATSSRPGMTERGSLMSDLSAVKALVFDVFGTVVDWRASLISDFTWWGRTRGIKADWTALVDGWRGVYVASMDEVRK